MGDQLVSGIVIFLIGVAALAASVALGWALARYLRADHIDTRDIVGVVGMAMAMFVLFMIGAFLCWGGVGVIVGG